MYNVRKKIKGFTVLELILALALGAIFSAIFFQFFFTHEKALNSTVIRSQLQMDMQQSMDYFSKSAMEASGISNINEIMAGNAEDIDSVNLGNTDTSQRLGELGITFLGEKSDPIQPDDTCNYSVVGKNFFYKKGSLEKTLCSDVSYVKIMPIDGKSFQECSGITIQIELIGEDEKTTYNITNNIYFRNKN